MSVCVTGAKYYATRCPFGLLAASLAATLRDSCGTRAQQLYERNRNMQDSDLLTPVIYIMPCKAIPYWGALPVGCYLFVGGPSVLCVFMRVPGHRKKPE